MLDVPYGGNHAKFAPVCRLTKKRFNENVTWVFGDAMFLFMVVLFACSQPLPYSREECALALEFMEACYRLNDDSEEDEFGRPIPPREARPDVYQIVERRKALGVSSGRSWWCSDPSFDTDYKHVPRFTPPLDSCQAIAR